MAEHSDLAEVRARVEQGGARKYHEAAAKSGKLFARERIALLIDEGSFAEDGRYGDLLAAGVPEGPAIGRGLRAALAAKLDRRALGREQELAEALNAAGMPQ